MERENKRRSFLKQLFSLLAFTGGSLLSYKGNRGYGIGKSGQIKVGLSEARAKGTGATRVKKIACEEHGAERDFSERLRAMDEAGIDMQVIGGGGGGLSDTKDYNDRLAEMAKKYPGRFAFYCALPWLNPDAAPAELQRAVKDLGLCGPMVYAGEGTGAYMDEQKFWPIYEMAEKLDVPIYIHPGEMLDDMSSPYKSPYPELELAMWGFAASTSLHAMRMILSGVFDKYPGLKIILGHMGEGIPYWLYRIDKGGPSKTDNDQPPQGFEPGREMVEGGLNNLPSQNVGPGKAMARGGVNKKLPSQYFKENFYIVTSGMAWNPVLEFCISVLGSDRILFGCDYPPEPDLVSKTQWIDSALISDSDREKICHLNAEKLLKI